MLIFHIKKAVWGQFWAARCSREYSRHKEYLRRNPGARLQFESNITDPMQVYRCNFPRQLMVRPQFVLEHFNKDTGERRLAKEIVREGSKRWIPVVQDGINDWYLATAKYLAVSYRRASFPDKTQEGPLSENIRRACDQCGLDAYWLDEHCTGNTWTEKNHDVYRIADVFRGADVTVIMIPDHEDNNTQESTSEETDQTKRKDTIPYQSLEWQLWGTRVWTFPEALLSKGLLFKLGYGSVTRIGLRQLTNIAFQVQDRKEIAAIIDHYSEKDTLSRLQLLSLLKDAIWRRGHSSDSHNNSRNPNVPQQSSYVAENACPAECVYALMGFFEHRIMPDGVETEEHALARLSMANDSDRFAERMISMLPSRIRQTACWYSDNDMYGANLWDIEPEVQVAGITESGALVLDGCHTASIRWKGFPKIQNRTKLGLRRSSAYYFSLISPILFIIGCAIVKRVTAGGALLLVLGVVGLVGAPWVVVYAHSGRIRFSEPWLIGVEGVLTAADVEFHLYGTRPNLGFPPKVTESPTGSIFAIPDTEDGKACT